MDLKCKNGKCDNVYQIGVNGKGRGFIGGVSIMWKCNVCGWWNMFIKSESGGEGVSINLEC